MTSSALGTESFAIVPRATVRVADQSVATTIWIVSVVLYIALATGTAMTRQPYGDEGELASPAYNLVHRGHMEVTQWEWARTSHKAYWMPPMYFLAQAAWQSVVGFGVIESRLATVMWGVILLFAAGYIVRKFTGNAVLASLVGLALATDYTYLQHAGVARCEIMSAALAILASAIYLLLRERSLSMAVFVSHTLMTLSGLTHPVGGIMWMPCLLGLQLWLDRRRLRWQHYVVGALPYFIGATAWGAYILQNPAEFRRQFFGVSLSEHRFAGLADPITALRRELGRFLGYYGVRPNASWAVRLKVLLPLGYLVGLLGGLLIPAVRKQRFIRACLLLVAVQLFILTFIEGTKQSHYIVHVIPTFVAILVALWWWLYSKRRWIFVAIALMYVFVQIGAVMFRVRENPYRKDFLPTVETMRPYVEQKLLVVSGPEFGTPFNFPENVISRADYGFRSARTPDIIVTSVAQYERNTVVARNDPPLYRYMTVTFHQRFHLIFSSGDFAVYKRTS